MNEYHCFEGQIEPMTWGDTTFTVLRLPADVAGALQAEGAKRVEGEFGEHPVNLALSKAPVLDGIFLWTGKTLLEASGLAPGERFEVRLKKADASIVEVPDDVRRALKSGGVLDDWEALTPGNRRGRLHQIETAKRAETRANRISKLVRDLA